jgi:hypothetical protein
MTPNLSAIADTEILGAGPQFGIREMRFAGAEAARLSDKLFTGPSLVAALHPIPAIPVDLAISRPFH